MRRLLEVIAAAVLGCAAAAVLYLGAAAVTGTARPPAAIHLKGRQ